MTDSAETLPAAAASEPIRVMVVDDSVVIRGFLTRFIETDPEIKVVSTAQNGQVALSNMERMSLDVVVLDIEMPVMDGLTALPHILKTDPHVQVIIASTLTKQNAAVTLKCFEIGAAECLAKPTSQELAGSNAFRDDLVQKVKELGNVARKKRGLPPKTGSLAAPSVQAAVSPGAIPAAAAAPSPATISAEPKKIALRAEFVKITPDVIAVGSSTGGPQALLQFFTDLKPGFRQPLFVTQHMPATFTAILAEHISKQSGIVCREAVEGEVVEGGRIYLAPGNFHMTVKDMGGKKIIALNQDPPENYCRPAVDPMIRSLTAAYGKKILAVILTGMGSDGMKSCLQVADNGGVVLAQDEATSVVWGMPGAVATAGACTRVLPLSSMAAAVREYIGFGG